MRIPKAPGWHIVFIFAGLWCLLIQKDWQLGMLWLGIGGILVGWRSYQVKSLKPGQS